MSIEIIKWKYNLINLIPFSECLLSEENGYESEVNFWWIYRPQKGMARGKMESYKLFSRQIKLKWKPRFDIRNSIRGLNRLQNKQQLTRRASRQVLMRERKSWWYFRNSWKWFETLFFSENFDRLQKAHIANWKVRVGKCFFSNSQNSFLSSRKTRKFNVTSQKSFLLERRFLFTCRITNSCLGQWNPSFCFLISLE